MTLTITLNGGPDNRWLRWGLICNPFPQIPRAEYAHVNAILQKLDSDPLTSTDQIREILTGCSQEFVDLCCRKFRKGKRVTFKVSWPD